jgi:exo-1,4-beta-D-glucosaminidase
MAIPRVASLSSTYFVRCQLSDAAGAPIVDNLYWQSTTDDDLGGPHNDQAFILDQVSWADFTALNTMPRAEVGILGSLTRAGDESRVVITLTNPDDHVAFFMRVAVTKGPGGEEVLPITYEDNYVTLFPRESRTLWARFRTADLEGRKAHLRVEGYNVTQQMAAME